MQDTENLYIEIFNIFNDTHPHEGVTLYLKFAQKQLSGNLHTSGSIANAILHIPGHTRSLSGSILRHKISLKSAILYPFIP